MMSIWLGQRVLEASLRGSSGTSKKISQTRN